MGTKPLKGLLINVYRSDTGSSDCTNGGVSAKAKWLLLVGPGVPEIFEEAPDRPVVRFKVGPMNTLRLVPDATVGKWVMFGGNYGSSSDSRFGEAVRAQGVQNDGFYPVPIFDRVE